MGQLDSGIHLVEDVEDVAKVQPNQTELLAVVTQTTLSVDDAAEIVAAVRARFPQVREPKQQDICYATQNRQDAVKVMSPQVDIVIVVGSPTSSNSNRLRELAERLGTPAHMVDAADDLQAAWFEGRPRVGLTAGASAPDILVQQVMARLKDLGAVIFDEVHYINDADRGHVWEESIILLPPTCRAILLSATMKDPVAFAEWVGAVRSHPITLLQTQHRIVPLEHGICNPDDPRFVIPYKCGDEAKFQIQVYQEWLRNREKEFKAADTWKATVNRVHEAGESAALAAARCSSRCFSTSSSVILMRW
jgi:Lhr-like helicase